MELLNLKAAALEAINDLRAEYGRDPLTVIPRGRRQDPEQCPVQQALADCGVTEVDELGYYEGDDAYSDLPPILRQFVAAVDDGGFPELEIGYPK